MKLINPCNSGSGGGGQLLNSVVSRTVATYTGVYDTTDDPIDEMDIVVTAPTGTTEVHLFWLLEGEATVAEKANCGVIVTKDGTALTNATDGDPWSLTAPFPYNTANTFLDPCSVSIVDYSPSIGVAVTYRVAVRSTRSGRSVAYQTNQATGGSAGSEIETGVSMGMAVGYS